MARAQELEAAGRDIIHLEIGEPDFSTAEPLGNAGIKAIRDGKTRYNPPRGITDLRVAIAVYTGKRHGMKIDPLLSCGKSWRKTISVFPSFGDY